MDDDSEHMARSRQLARLPVGKKPPGQDQASVAAKGHSDEFKRLTTVQRHILSASRLHHKPDLLGDSPSGCIIGQPLVLQRALRPSAVGKAQAGILVG
jgi:hypothetical protein